MMEIIPAIDLINGQCVRLSQGDFNSIKNYSSDPVAVARKFEDAGLRRLHVVDLEGARAAKTMHLKTLEHIATQTNLVIDFSGGIQSEDDVRSVFSAGASIAGIGSFATREPTVFMNWISIFGQDKILLGADVRNESLAVKGWTEQTDISVFDFIAPLYEQGLRQFFCTDINTDGMLQGSAVTLYRKLLHQFPALKLIASGGVSSLSDIDDLVTAGCAGVIIGKAIYEGHISLAALKKYNVL